MLIVPVFGRDDRTRRVDMSCANSAMRTGSKNNPILQGLEYMHFYDSGLCSCLVHMFFVG